MKLSLIVASVACVVGCSSTPPAQSPNNASVRADNLTRSIASAVSDQECDDRGGVWSTTYSKCFGPFVNPELGIADAP